MHVTFFKTQGASFKSESQLELDDLARLIRDTRARKKSDLPWLKLARFGNAKSPKGSLRYDANVLAVSGVEMDYDAKSVPMSTAIATLTESRLRSLVYTSPTNSRDEPKWRVLCPFSEELIPPRRRVMALRLQNLFNGIFARESLVLSQAYYYGAVEGNAAHEAVVIDGEPINHRNELDPWIAEPAREARKKKKRPTDGEIDPELMRLAMAIIPNEDRDWNDWNRIGMALWAALGGDHFEIFDAWSKKSNKYDPQQTEERWNTYFNCPPNNLGVGTIIYEANGAWPPWRSAYDEENERRIREANANA